MVCRSQCWLTAITRCLKSETKFADGVLHYKRTFEIKDVMVPKEKLPAIRDFLQQVAADQQSAAVLRRAAP